MRHISWSPTGDMLASASFDGSTCVWVKETDPQTGHMDFSCIQQLQDHQSEVKSVEWSQGGHEFPG